MYTCNEHIAKGYMKACITIMCYMHEVSACACLQFNPLPCFAANNSLSHSRLVLNQFLPPTLYTQQPRSHHPSKVVISLIIHQGPHTQPMKLHTCTMYKQLNTPSNIAHSQHIDHLILCLFTEVCPLSAHIDSERAARAHYHIFPHECK